MKKKTWQWLLLGIAGLAALIAIVLWKPLVLVIGVQRAGLYAAVALPMALIIGIVHIVNLAHGETMMVAAYVTYFLSQLLGLDPLIALIPVAAVMFLFGALLYSLTIKHALKAPELNQLILTFGIAITLSQVVNLVATSQSKKLSLSYVTASMSIGNISFGVYDFIFPALAVLICIGLLLFLRRTKMGQAALAVGQNPKGAMIVGIDVNRTYLIVFSIAIMLVGIMGAFFLTKRSIFPGVGGPYTMKSFCLVAMAGMGNLPGILYCSLLLGLAESTISAFKGMAGWADIVFFLIIIGVIMSRAIGGKKA